MLQEVPIWATEIKAARKRLGESQNKFAERFKVAVNTVSRWETGTYDPSPEVMWWLLHEGNDQLAKLRDLVKIQGMNGTWNYDSYMRGMYNGMELMLACLEGREPNYRHAPKKYLYDTPQKRIASEATQHDKHS